MGAEHTLRTEELSRDVQGLASHNDDLLTVSQLLSHSAGQPTKEVTLAVDGDLFHPVVSRLLETPLAIPSHGCPDC
jgi:hypothetical protein